MNERQGMNREVFTFYSLLPKSSGKDGCRLASNIFYEQKSTVKAFGS